MLIKIDVNENQEKLVSARELHEFLEVGRDFTTWIKARIKRYKLKENVQFTVVSIAPPIGGAIKGGQNKIDYLLKLETAKGLCMVESNEKGEQARQYFIECERKLNETKNEEKVRIEFNPELQFIQERVNRIRILEEQYRSIIEQLKYEYEMIGSRSAIMQMQLNDLRGPLHLRKALGNIVYNPPK